MSAQTATELAREISRILMRVSMSKKARRDLDRQILGACLEAYRLAQAPWLSSLQRVCTVAVKEVQEGKQRLKTTASTE